MSSSTLRIRDLTLRDGQQSLFATRMSMEQIQRVLPDYRDAGFYAMEVWGGAVPDSVMRYLQEDPWARLEGIKSGIGDRSHLTALSRGRNLFGYNPYPDDVIDGFCRHAVQSGIGIMRIFDALNDLNNLKSTIRSVKKYGGMADCAVCYTVDSHLSGRDKWLSLLHGRGWPKPVFTKNYFLGKARALQDMGADIISIKDMAGLITPQAAWELVTELKSHLKVPINFHSHCTPGFGLASGLMAILAGVDIMDTVLWHFAGGPAAPAFELMEVFCRKLGITTGVDLKATARINRRLREIRQELREFDGAPEHLPLEADMTSAPLADNMDAVFDEAIQAAQSRQYQRLLSLCHHIEQHYHFPPPSEAVREAQIPGGMYTNMLAQLKSLKLDHLFDRVLTRVPQVRLNAGSPPLVTPTSQIIGVQAVNCVIDENAGNPPYTTQSTQFVNLVKGSYGETPVPIAPRFRQAICGHPEFRAYVPETATKVGNRVLHQFGNRWMAGDEKEQWLLELLPNVAEGFLMEKRRRDHEAGVYPPDHSDPLGEGWNELPEWAGACVAAALRESS